MLGTNVTGNFNFHLQSASGRMRKKCVNDRCKEPESSKCFHLPSIFSSTRLITALE